MRLIISALFMSFLTYASIAGEADVLDVKVRPSGDEFRFAVTVRHDDTGWDHYADGWEVVGEDGTVYGKRVLAHPHVDEQPFTRAGTFKIPDGIKTVIIRAHDSVDAYGGKEIKVALPGR
ncbi:MAG: hypothetical protein AAGA53_00365 [Pseudomonadota bacterium]